MAPIVPDPAKIKAFQTEAAFEAWMNANHARETELWLKIYKKGSGLATITYAAGARRRLVLGVDRRHPQVVRRAVVSAALHAAPGEAASGARSIAITWLG